MYVVLSHKMYMNAQEKYTSTSIQSDLFTTSPLVVLPYTSIQSDLFTTSPLVVLPYTSIQSVLFTTPPLVVLPYTSIGSTTKGDVVKRSDCILVYGSTTKGGVVKRTDCILVYGSTTKGGVVKRSDCILVYQSILFTTSPLVVLLNTIIQSDLLQEILQYDVWKHRYIRVNTCTLLSFRGVLQLHWLLRRPFYLSYTY